MAGWNGSSSLAGSPGTTGPALRKDDPVPPGTATLSLARDFPGLSGGETRSAAGPARKWFDGASRHLEVEEDAIEMGNYGRVLTLLAIRGLAEAAAI